MAMTAAERQARHRARMKGRAAEPVEGLIERERQALFADWIEQLEGEGDSAALIRDVAARPARTGEAFKDWLAALLSEDIEREVRQARKDASKGRKPRQADLLRDVT